MAIHSGRGERLRLESLGWVRELVKLLCCEEEEEEFLTSVRQKCDGMEEVDCKHEEELRD